MKTGKQTDRAIWDAIDVLSAEAMHQARSRVELISGNGCDDMDAETTDNLRAEQARIASTTMSNVIAAVLQGKRVQING